MAATGNEVPTLKQLKEYVAYASDEALSGYLTPKPETELTVMQPSSGYLDGVILDNIVANVDEDGTVSISGYLRYLYDTYAQSNDIIFEITPDYAPKEIISFNISNMGACELDTNGFARYVGSYAYIYSDTTYRINSPITYSIPGFSEEETLTGKEVVRLSQLKTYLDGNGSGSGGGGGSSWETWWSGAFTPSSSNSTLSLQSKSGSYSKIRFTVECDLSGTVSKTFEFYMPTGMTSYYYTDIGDMVFDGDYILEVAILGTPADNPTLKFYTSVTYTYQYYTIRKIEIM